jgi:hypothetical protein
MSKPSPRHRTALVLGCESPAGRAIALTLSRNGCRVVVSGDDAAKLKVLSDLIEAKKGDPLLTALPKDPARVVPVLRAARETMGHYHFVVNALATVEPPVDDPQAAYRRAATLHEHVLQLTEGRGTVRFLTLWPDDAGPAPLVPIPNWHCVVRYDRIQMESEEQEPTAIRAGGAADTVALLLGAPASACPAEVRLAIRELKSLRDDE